MSNLPSERNRLRICVLTFLFPPNVGGAEAQADKHARQLQAMGHEVLVITLSHRKEWKRAEINNGLPIIRIGGLYRRGGRLNVGRLGRIPIEIIALLKLWQFRHRYDVIHTMQLSSLSAIGTFICRLTRKPIIISIQSAGPSEEQLQVIKQKGALFMADTLTNLDASQLAVGEKDWTPGDLESLPQSSLGGSFMLNYLRESDAYYQVLSNRSRHYLISHGFRQEQIIHIPNGIDTEKYRPGAQRPDPAKPERDIISVARLEYPKGVDVLLHAWARMLREPDQWRAQLKPRLLLVGDGMFRPLMERIARDLDIMDSVEFLGTRQDVLEMLQKAWGFVIPSRWEGMPNALIEAMACGLPCVATRVSGSEDAIIDGINGLLVPPEQPAPMAQALRRIIEDSQFAQQLAQEARATTLHNYQIQTVTEKSVKTYYRLLSRGNPILPFVQEEMGGM
ncbi:glycosyltransferase family 1 protein [Ktedonosporobacter rubrisoli]|uniref:Glycosyltransferase family 1 protein n=1 Tax=Ktedonosporobacter rubrisoli TaxID=2509675 RepID=A0A4V0YZ40_KTERU|nr:glycosyltransferase family 4 protein [Ktedonosporobacter rubrisoli]QBD78391.1 glycosyltransferase family 1 protein [Ktedonosporobacter rubrisoli]